jgi:hypothetical protein
MKYIFASRAARTKTLVSGCKEDEVHIEKDWGSSGRHKDGEKIERSTNGTGPNALESCYREDAVVTRRTSSYLLKW